MNILSGFIVVMICIGIIAQAFALTWAINKIRQVVDSIFPPRKKDETHRKDQIQN